MSDFTMYRPAATAKLSATATAAESGAAPRGAIGVHVYCSGQVRIDFSGGTATDASMPFGPGAGHYVGTVPGQKLSFIRGATESANVDLWLTWVRKPV